MQSDLQLPRLISVPSSARVMTQSTPYIRQLRHDPGPLSHRILRCLQPSQARSLRRLMSRALDASDAGPGGPGLGNSSWAPVESTGSNMVATVRKTSARNKKKLIAWCDINREKQDKRSFRQSVVTVSSLFRGISADTARGSRLDPAHLPRYHAGERLGVKKAIDRLGRIPT